MGFDQKTSDYLKHYVYALVDPSDGKPFYIGKGVGNRVYNHVACALEEATINDKYSKIQEILSRGDDVKHLILRHGMDKKTAYDVESALIDSFVHFGFQITNEVFGHHSSLVGLMSADEIERKYNAERLELLSDPVILININRTYKRGSGAKGIYSATKESWVVSRERVKKIQYALAEYRGFIVEVFRITPESWYPVLVKDKNGKEKTRWGFEGHVADDSVRLKYFQKSVAHTKKRGSSNPIRYKL